MTVRAQPSRHPAQRFPYRTLIREMAHQRVVRTAVHGENPVPLRRDAPALDHGGGGVGQRPVLQRPRLVIAGELHSAHVVNRAYAGDSQLGPARRKAVERIAKAPQLIRAGSGDRLKARAEAANLSVNVAEDRQTHLDCEEPAARGSASFPNPDTDPALPPAAVGDSRPRYDGGPSPSPEVVEVVRAGWSARGSHPRTTRVGYSREEIAELTGDSHRTIDRHLERPRRQLRDALPIYPA